MGYLIIFLKSLYSQKLNKQQNDLAEDSISKKKKKKKILNSIITVSTGKNSPKTKMLPAMP